MVELRKYGTAPFSVAVIHGGPGAPGTMAPVAQKLSLHRGILEPMQSADSLGGQVIELKNTIEAHGNLPITLIGSSWGAWLGFMLAARFPILVKKLFLVGSGPFEEQYAKGIFETRLGRLAEDERREVYLMMDTLNSGDAEGQSNALTSLGKIFTLADTYNPLTLETGSLPVQYQVFQKVWGQAAQLRRSGELLKMAKQIQCPVVALHGDYDPHPAEGVRIPLVSALSKFEFILLKNCGHLPWIEREASAHFFKILDEKIEQK